MIKTGIDLTQYHMTSLGGDVVSGKTFIMGLLVDELLYTGHRVMYINAQGSTLKFDINHPNARNFVYSTPKAIYDFCRQINDQQEEVYIFIDDIGSINFGSGSHNHNYYDFITVLKKFKYIKTIISYNNNKNGSFYKANRNTFEMNSDFHISVEKKVLESVFNPEASRTQCDTIYLNDKYLCSMYDLVKSPEIRNRERKLYSILD